MNGCRSSYIACLIIINVIGSILEQDTIGDLFREPLIFDEPLLITLKKTQLCLYIYVVSSCVRITIIFACVRACVRDLRAYFFTFACLLIYTSSVPPILLILLPRRSRFLPVVPPSLIESLHELFLFVLAFVIFVLLLLMLILLIL